MILITGTDPVVDATCAALEGSGRAYRRVETLDAGGAWGAGATTVVLVEPLPRAGATASASGHGLREIISAASAPGVRSAILVTPRPDADAELRAVRRSGIPPHAGQTGDVVPPAEVTWTELLARAGATPKPVAGA